MHFTEWTKLITKIYSTNVLLLWDCGEIQEYNNAPIQMIAKSVSGWDADFKQGFLVTVDIINGTMIASELGKCLAQRHTFNVHYFKV